MNILTWAEYLAAPDTDGWLYDYREDPEQIGYEDAVDAMEAALDDAHPEVLNEVMVYAFQHAAKPDAEEWASDTLDNLLDSLDESYGDSDGGATEPTPAMREAMTAAVRVVLADYTVWRCDIVAEIIVRREDLPDLWAGYDEAIDAFVEGVTRHMRPT